MKRKADVNGYELPEMGQVGSETVRNDAGAKQLNDIEQLLIKLVTTRNDAGAKQRLKNDAD